MQPAYTPLAKSWNIMGGYAFRRSVRTSIAGMGTSGSSLHRSALHYWGASAGGGLVVCQLSGTDISMWVLIGGVAPPLPSSKLAVAPSPGMALHPQPRCVRFFMARLARNPVRKNVQSWKPTETGERCFTHRNTQRYDRSIRNEYHTGFSTV